MEYTQKQLDLTMAVLKGLLDSIDASRATNLMRRYAGAPPEY